MSSLNVWMNGELVGEWSTSRAGTATFRYVQTWVDSPNARALSLSLPLTADRKVRGPIVDHYFDNFLPDNPNIRRRIRERFGLHSTDAFDLLEAAGRDCVGAVQLLPPSDQPSDWNRIDATRLGTVHREDWMDAYADSGKGSTSRRSAQIRWIYEQSAPPISSSMQPAAREFLTEVVRIVRNAVEESGGSFGLPSAA